jgi:hypothetical protein
MAVLLGAIKDLTSNQYYRGLNKRFDNRVKKLSRAGFYYDKEYNAFIPKKYKNKEAKFKEHYKISNELIMHADNRVFNNLIIRNK